MRKESKRFAVLVFVVVLAIALIASTYYVFVVLKNARDHRTDRERTFTGTALTLENGTAFDVKEFGTKPVIVVSWATWCPSCIDALTLLSTVKEKYGDTIVLVAVNRKEEKQIIDNYKNAIGLPKNCILVNDIHDVYFKNIDGRSMPEILIYDAKGTMVEHLIATPTEHELVTILDKLVLK